MSIKPIDMQQIAQALSPPVVATTFHSSSTDPLQSELKLTSPMLAKFELEGILKTPFFLTPEEESLLFGLTRDPILSLDISLFEIFCFNVYHKLNNNRQLFPEKELEFFVQSFLLQWIALSAGHVKEVQPFIKLLHSFCNQLISLSYDKSGKPSSMEDKIRQDGHIQHIHQQFDKQIALVLKFLEKEEARPLLFRYPISYYQDCKTNLPLGVELKTVYTNIGSYLSFVFLSLKTIHSLDEPVYEKLIQYVSERISSFGVLTNTEEEVQKLDPLFEALRMVIGKTSSYFYNTSTQIQIDILQLFEIYKDQANKSSNNNQVVNILNGKNVFLSTAVSIKNTNDCLVRFKTEKLIPQTFRLTAEQQKCLLDLFTQYPLDSSLTFIDFFPYVVWKSLDALSEKLSVDRKKDFKNIVNKIGFSFLLLLFGYTRRNPEIIKLVGPLNAFSASYAFDLQHFIQEFKKDVQMLKKFDTTNASSRASTTRTDTVKHRFQKSVAEVLHPLEDLLQALMSGDHSSLILYSVNWYQGCEALDAKPEKSEEILNNYWRFQKERLAYGLEKKLIGLSIKWGFLDRLVATPTQHSMSGKEAVSQLIALNLLLHNSNVALHEACKGTLTHEEWASINQIKVERKQVPLEFREYLTGNINLLTHYKFVITDMMRVVQNRYFPERPLNTFAACYRCLFFFLRLKQEPSAAMKPSLVPEITTWIHQSLIPFSECLKDTFFNDLYKVLNENSGTLVEATIWATLIQWLSPVQETIIKKREELLHTLSGLPHKLQPILKKYFQSLSLEELKKLQVEDINNFFFEEGLKYAKFLFLFTDILVILQQMNDEQLKHFIPSELADVLMPDGIEELLQQAIQSKTIGKQEVVTVQKTLPTDSSPANKQKKPQKEEFDPQEITQLTKSKKIYSRLLQMGFLPQRQTGSHIMMKNESEQLVILPNNSNLPIGTRKVIAQQVQIALESDNNNNNNAHKENRNNPKKKS